MRLLIRRPSAALLLALAAGLDGCGIFGTTEEQPIQEVKSTAAPGRPKITVGELDQLSRNYADRLVARVSTACDEIKRDSRDERVRKRAHELKLSIALAAYDIVTSEGESSQLPEAAQHVLDLAILTELNVLRWVDEHAARDMFGERAGEGLAAALSKSREDIPQIESRVMTSQELDRLRTMILQWRQDNPQVEWLSRVRLDVVARGPAGASFTQSLSESFNPLHPVIREVDETRLLARQCFFWIKRAPLIADWALEATVSDGLSVPKVAALVQNLTGTLAQLEHAVGTVDKLLEPGSQEPAIHSTLSDVRETLLQARDLIREVHALEIEVQPLLERWEKVPATASGKKDYEAVASKVDDAARHATSFIRELRALAESPDAVRGLDDVLGRANLDVSKTGRELINLATLRAIEVVMLMGILVVVYKAAAYLVTKRRSRTGDSKTG
jgi:hypothetical protein